MQVKYLDLQKQFDNTDILSILEEQLKICQFIMGPEVKKFESDFAKLCGSAFALGVNSCTDALFLALKALDVGPGDEVITVPNSFVATVGAIMATGAKPVFVDVCNDYNIDDKLIEPAITSRTKAIIPVHLTGNPARMTQIMKIAKRAGLFVIEDAAQSIGASIADQSVGSFGDIGCFSLHPLKNLNVCGDGGVLVTNSKAICKKVELLRNHGLLNRDEIEFFGYNSRLDTLQAAIGSYVMDKLKITNEKRRQNAFTYNQELKELSEYISLPSERSKTVPVYHTYVIMAERRTELRKYLQAHDVETKIHYPIPIHLQKPCKIMGYKRGDFPVCERQSQKILSLPIHQHLTNDQINYVANLIKIFYSKK